MSYMHPDQDRFSGGHQSALARMVREMAERFPLDRPIESEEDKAEFFTMYESAMLNRHLLRTLAMIEKDPEVEELMTAYGHVYMGFKCHGE